jgi:hypothetical protein
MTLDEWQQYLDKFDVDTGVKSLEELAASAEHIVVSLGKFLAHVDRHDQIKCAVFINLLSYLHHELTNLVKWKAESCDVIAWVSRNILEARLWTTYVLDKPSNFDRFLHEQEVDLREVYERLGDWERNVAAEESDFSAMAKSISERHAELRRPRNRVKLALRPGDVPMYKHLSKYVHATSWLINGQVELMNSESYRKLSLSVAQWDAQLMISAVVDEGMRIGGRARRRKA